jgi:signal transduction histidine kinase
LISHGQRLGALSLLYSDDSGRRYTDVDIPLAEDLARRCAQAVENAQLYRAAEHAVALRDEFLSVAAHELKTPMTSLHGAVQLLMRQHDKGVTLELGQMYRVLQMIDRQTARLSRLVSQLLETSRFETGRLAPDWSEVDLVSLVASVVEQVQASAPRHTVVLSTPPAAIARVDGLRVEQVIGNLLDNAVKFSPDGGQIDVELSIPAPELVRLAVRDRGIGIPPEYRRQIFDRYYQAHAESHRSGLGLGLYISRRIVELHGGQIRVEFPEDGGTRFVVELPAVPSPGVPRAQPP